jgi:hypothetical protein
MNSQTEQFNREVLAYLSTYITKKQDSWALWLKMVQFAYHNTLMTTMGTSPFSVTCNYQPHMGTESTIPAMTPGESFAKTIGCSHKEIAFALQKTCDRMLHAQTSK